MDVEHEPTDNMVADFFTKPLQDSAFRKFRKLILNKSEKRGMITTPTHTYLHTYYCKRMHIYMRTQNTPCRQQYNLWNSIHRYYIITGVCDETKVTFCSKEG